MAHDELTPGEAALIEEYEALLADPSLWADVPAELEERVVDAITAEAAGATTGWYTYERPSRARRWLATAGAAAVGAAAAAAIVLLVTHDSSRPMPWSRLPVPTSHRASPARPASRRSPPA